MKLKELLKQVHTLRPDFTEIRLLKEAQKSGSTELNLKSFLYNAKRGELLPFERGPLVDVLNRVPLQKDGLARTYMVIKKRLTEVLGIEKAGGMKMPSTLSFKKGTISHRHLYDLIEKIEEARNERHG